VSTNFLYCPKRKKKSLPKRGKKRGKGGRVKIRLSLPLSLLPSPFLTSFPRSKKERRGEGDGPAHSLFLLILPLGEEGEKGGGKEERKKRPRTITTRVPRRGGERGKRKAGKTTLFY